MFEAAVQDIEYAFKYGYPKELQFKVGFPFQAIKIGNQTPHNKFFRFTSARATRCCG